jgi:hypothetical protein
VGAGHDTGTTAEMLHAWIQPEFLETSALPEPGDRIYAAVVTRAHKAKAEAVVTVGRQPFQDIAMVPAGPIPPAGCKP